MNTGIASLDKEPRYKISEMVEEIAGRRDLAIQEMNGELKKLLLGLVDQFAVLKKENPYLDLRTVRFQRIRWLKGEGVIVIDVFHNQRRMTAPEVRGW